MWWGYDRSPRPPSKSVSHICVSGISREAWEPLPASPRSRSIGFPQSSPQQEAPDKVSFVLLTTSFSQQKIGCDLIAWQTF
eukprot:scaffold60035_cov14-Prasinocladus_malaysianus.AAC.1